MPVARAVLTGSDLGHTAIFSSHPVMTFLRDHVLVPVLRLPAVQNAILDRTAELGVNYRDSSLSAEFGARLWFGRAPHAGDRAPDAEGRDADGTTPVRLFDLFRGTHFTLLLFADPTSSDATCHRLAATAGQARQLLGDDLCVHLVVAADRRPAILPAGLDVLLDPDRDAHGRYGVTSEALYLIRPDGYVAFRSRPATAEPLREHLAAILAGPEPADPTPSPRQGADGVESIPQPEGAP